YPIAELMMVPVRHFELVGQQHVVDALRRRQLLRVERGQLGKRVPGEREVVGAACGIGNSQRRSVVVAAGVDRPLRAALQRAHQQRLGERIEARGGGGGLAGGRRFRDRQGGRLAGGEGTE